MVAVRLSGCSEIDSHGCCEIERLGAQAVLEILEDYFSLDKETALEALQVYRRFDEQTNQQVPPAQQAVAGAVVGGTAGGSGADRVAGANGKGNPT